MQEGNYAAYCSQARLREVEDKVCDKVLGSATGGDDAIGAGREIVDAEVGDVDGAVDGWVDRAEAGPGSRSDIGAVDDGVALASDAVELEDEIARNRALREDAQVAGGVVGIGPGAVFVDVEHAVTVGIAEGVSGIEAVKPKSNFPIVGHAVSVRVGRVDASGGRRTGAP